MTKFTAQGTEVYIQDLDSTLAIPAVAITGVSNAKPAVVSVAAASIAAFVEGSLVTIAGTQSAIDGKSFLIGAVDTDNFELQGSDLSANTTTIATGTATPIDDAAMLRFCLSSWEWQVEAADAIDVTTFCGSESLAGTPLPGTISIEGFTDMDVSAQTEWRDAVFDGQRRIMHVVLPGSRGDIIMTITISGYTLTMETNEAVSFAGEAVVNEVPQFLTADSVATFSLKGQPDAPDFGTVTDEGTEADAKELEPA